MTELCNLFEEEGSDKCPAINHTYSPVYYELLKHRRYQISSVLEIGVGSYLAYVSKIAGPSYSPGASLRAWERFFPNAHIYGFDIDRAALFQDESISTFYADQSNEESLLEGVRQTDEPGFDLIVDDGSHQLEHMMLSLRVLAPFIREQGLYIVEDIRIKWFNLFVNLKIPDMYLVEKYNGTKSEWDNFVAYEKQYT